MAEQQNPYLALLQQEEQAPSTAQLLRMFANLVGGASAGIGQTGTWGGVAPGLMMGINANAQDADQAERRRLQKAQIGIHASKWDEERAERQQNAAAMRGLGGLLTAPGTDQGATTLGVTAPQGSPVKLGPDLVSAGTPVVNYLTTKHGFTPLGAATVAGNLYQESKFNTGAVGDSGTAFGMGQWRLDRQDKLKAFAASQQKPVTDPQVQLDYLVSEMQGGDMGAQRAYAELKRATTPQEANAAMMHFFRPQGYTPANPSGGLGYQNRVQYTQALLPNGQPVPQGEGGPSGSPAGPAPESSRQPQFASLPPFVGAGFEGTVQPGATSAPQLSAPPMAQPPPQVAQGDNVTAGGSPVDRSVPAPQFVGDPNVVQTGGPQPPPQAPTGRPPPDMPPKIPPPSPMQLSPEAKERLRILTTLPNIKPIQFATEMNKEIQAEWQQRQEQVVKGWERQWSEYGHYRGLSEQQIKTDQDRRYAEVQAQIKREQGLQDEGQFVTKADGTREWVPKGKLPGTVEHPAPKDQYEVVSKQNAQMELGEAYDPKVAYQRNLATKKLEPIRTGAETSINIDQKGESEFAKKMGAYDAERFSEILKAEAKLNDTSTKLAYALDQFKQTYTGPGAEAANQLNKVLGAAGFEKAGEKANAADAAMAALNEMKPLMRAPGSGTSSDKDVDLIGKALPSLMNLPGGNEKIVGYFQKLADRATEVRRLAQEHSNNGKTPLTQTGFDDAVKKLGPLLREDERKELADLGKTKIPPPPPGFTVPKPGAASTAPPPPAGFKVQ